MEVNPYREALDGWTRDKWRKGMYVGPDESNCLVGRLAGAKWVDDWEDDVRPWDADEILLGIINEQYPGLRKRPIVFVPDFNDHENTTFEDVTRVLEKAAVAWDEGKRSDAEV